jgi:hypothetical protein
LSGLKIERIKKAITALEKQQAMISSQGRGLTKSVKI